MCNIICWMSICRKRGVIYLYYVDVWLFIIPCHNWCIIFIMSSWWNSSEINHRKELCDPCSSSRLVHRKQIESMFIAPDEVEERQRPVKDALIFKIYDMHIVKLQISRCIHAEYCDCGQYLWRQNPCVITSCSLLWWVQKTFLLRYQYSTQLPN